MQTPKIKKEGKIWVAGHRGLLGSAVHRRLVAGGYKNIVYRTSQELDLTDTVATHKFLEVERPDYVVLCAAKVGGIKANMEALGEFLFKNLEIQNNVIDGARRFGVKRLLFVGSSCIYPKDTPVPIREEQLMTGALEPTNEGYALAKIAGIKMCEFYRKQYGCDFITAIPTNLYGINDNYDVNSAHLIPALIRKVHAVRDQKNPEIEVWGSGKPRREFMLSDDCADGLVHLLENYEGSMPINVGTGEDATVIELAETVGRVLGVKIGFRMDASKPDGMMRKVMDISRIRQMGWKPKHSLEEGIKIAYADFLKKNA